jgi:hypothetical protein
VLNHLEPRALAEARAERDRLAWELCTASVQLLTAQNNYTSLHHIVWQLATGALAGRDDAQTAIDQIVQETDDSDGDRAWEAREPWC